MADWPDADELRRVLNVNPEVDDELAATLDRVLASAISHVKADVGTWDEATDEPTDGQSAAALRMAELLALRPENAAAVGEDPTYRRHLFGTKRRFGIS